MNWLWRSIFRRRQTAARPPVAPAALATPPAIASAASTTVVEAAASSVWSLLVGPLGVLNGRSRRCAGIWDSRRGGLGSGRLHGIAFFRLAPCFILRLRNILRK